MKIIKVAASLVLLLLIGLAWPHKVGAANASNFTGSALWTQSSCTGTINGMSQSEKNGYGIAQGDNFTLSIKNNSSYDLLLSITQGSSVFTADLPSGATYSNTYDNIQSNLVVDAGDDSTNTCGAKQTQGEVTIQPGSASLSCATVEGNKGYGWDLTGSYTNVVVQASLFEGSTNVESYESGSSSLSENFVAGSSTTVFYFYNGFTPSSELLTQATCNPPTTATSSNPPITYTNVTPSSGTSSSSSSQVASTPQSTAAAVAATANSPVQLKTIEVGGQKVTSNQPLSINQNQSLTIGGTTVANGTVSLTIHSTPKTVSAKANSNGVWQYTISGLAPGNHYIEASVLAPGATLPSVTSKLISFNVKQAAVTNQTPTKPATNTLAYIIILLVIVIFAPAIMLYLRGRKQNQVTPNSSGMVTPSGDVPKAITEDSPKEDESPKSSS